MNEVYNNIEGTRCDCRMMKVKNRHMYKLVSDFLSLVGIQTGNNLLESVSNSWCVPENRSLWAACSSTLKLIVWNNITDEYVWQPGVHMSFSICPNIVHKNPEICLRIEISALKEHCSHKTNNLYSRDVLFSFIYSAQCHHPWSRVSSPAVRAATSGRVSSPSVRAATFLPNWILFWLAC